MGSNLEQININFCEQNGNVIMTYDINETLSALIPNVGDVVNIDGNYRAVSERAFTYSARSIIVTIYLEEL
ncbi:hypothetical protein LAV72_18110 [Lysinibacillus xylanilyticus]|uniref:hypothetical protein n=1 Tax=Lysinibacillus xylanilyticus TaxID=582475 RepID=UPI002B2519BA|nr:hypothetical protein [Lysinibacillus xylanilyticus]MEB2301522.1 hypothetical protein [Lysinibacillus xylanilyticus]